MSELPLPPKYNPPSKVWSNDQLIGFYSNCGVKSEHTRCLRCGHLADLAHRLGWLTECTEPCGTCGRVNKKIKHVGKFCFQQKQTYADVFDAAFLESHAGVNLRPWDNGFIKKYGEVRERLTRAAKRGSSGQRSKTESSKPKSGPRSTSASKSSREPDEKEPDDEVAYGIRLSKKLDDIRLAKKLMEMEDRKKAGKRKRDVSPEPDVNFDEIDVEHVKKGFSHKRPAKKCFNCGNVGHLSSACPVPQCMQCLEAGHEEADCPELKDKADKSASRKKLGDQPPLTDGMEGVEAEDLAELLRKAKEKIASLEEHLREEQHKSVDLSRRLEYAARKIQKLRQEGAVSGDELDFSDLDDDQNDEITKKMSKLGEDENVGGVVLEEIL